MWLVNPSDKTRIPVRLLLDSGSNSTFFTNHNSLNSFITLASQQKISIQTMGKSSDSCIRDIYMAKLALSPNSSKDETTLDIHMIMVDVLCGKIYSPTVTNLQKSFIENNKIKLADSAAAKGGYLDVDILIGQDYYHKIVCAEKFYLSGGLVLIRTLAGYSLAGTAGVQIYSEEINHSPLGLFKVHTNDAVQSPFYIRDQELENIKKLVSLETLGVKPLEEISPILDRFNHTTIHNGERYSAFLPKRPKLLKRLPSNFAHAFKRLINGHQQLLRPEKKKDLEDYCNIMKDQLEAGVLERVACIGTIDEVQRKLDLDIHAFDNINALFVDSKVHYLPHFSVRKNHTGKMRLVYDAAAKIHPKSLSLNDCLETGPDLINSLISILIRFRLYKYALKSDIEKAFLQIEIQESDRDLLRTLWIEDSQIWIFRFARLPFGITCAPFILAATLAKHLTNTTISDEKKLKILGSFYVDDNVSGADSFEELVEFKSSIQEIFSQAGMPLRQFNSNHKELRDLLSASEESVPDVESVLGIKWNVNDDTLSINCNHIVEPLGPKKGRKRSPLPNTKRGVYSKIARTFDVLGLVSPFMFQGKLILRDVCENTDVKSWDAKLPDKLLESWNKWEHQLTFLEKFKVPRFIGVEKPKNVTLVGFCDASKLGFAACIYYVVQDNDGNFMSNLLVSKTHVAPKKLLDSIPRLELCGALLLANLMSHVKIAIPNMDNCKVSLFTDSADVLFWIRSLSLDWPVFVANRLKEILTLTETESWRHVTTNDNPADIPSRGCKLENLLHDETLREFWFHGPHWLKYDISKYKSQVDLRIIPAGCREELGQVVLTTKIFHPPKSVSSIININKFNSFLKLIRVTRLVLKAITLLSPKLLNKKLKLNTSHIENTDRAEILWIKAVQIEYYNDFFILCKKQKSDSPFSNISAESKNKFLKLNIFMDEKLGILRCHSRIQNSFLSYSTVNPILLPPESPYTLLVVKNTHVRLLHAGKSQTVAAVRSKFWIPRLTRLTSNVINKCMSCRKACSPVYQLPPSPDLPDFRVQKIRPFKKVGLDYAGPFTTRERFVDKSFFDYKSYILIFTCSASRGVHFEATNSLNSMDFNLALNRFVSERGIPDLIVSDNAKTFKTNSRKLKTIAKDSEIQTTLDLNSIQWHFYTEKAPWMGGFIERVVGLFKQHFLKVVRSNPLSFEEFRTVVKSSQAVINSRPLTYLCDGLDEGVPLTPSMLIHGYTITDLPSYSNIKISEDTTQSNELKLGERYSVLEKAKNHFWNVWTSQYLTELVDRHMRLKKNSPNIRVPKVGDICLLRKEKMPRCRWPLAIIERVDISSRDNAVRTVGVRTLNEKGKPSILNRSPSFLVPLEEDLKEDTRPDITPAPLIEL